MNKKSKLKMAIGLFIVCFALAIDFGNCENIEERFAGKQSLFYEVSFNGIPTGKIEWQYLGKENVNGRPAEAVSLISDTKILKLLNLESTEKVFLDSSTYLPLVVERDVVFFGKKELIKEVYDQDAGLVTVTKSNSSGKKIILHQKKPIHNILSLLYFFPKDIKLVKGKELYFNLPTQKVKIKMLSETSITFDKKKKEVYFLSGTGDKRFNLWLDKQERTPVKMEFLVPLGKITIIRKG